MTRLETNLYVGPMSKNVVDAVLEFSTDTGTPIGFIPSRRQVEHNGGYVNGWDTKAFSSYVNGRAIIERDHGGPHQGARKDLGRVSYSADAKYFDIIHVDPWKATQDLHRGIGQTIEDVFFLNSKNPDLFYEVGTEEAIRPFTEEELEYMLQTLKTELPQELFKKIKYAVVQSGVGLDLGNQINTGKFSEQRLVSMLDVCRKFSIQSKEHNGDYLGSVDIKKRFDLGLSALNIAPEFGQIETKCYVGEMSQESLDEFYDICLVSEKWKKWVPEGFNPEDEKEKLVIICGHYVFSDPRFKEIKPNIDEQVKMKVKERLSKIFNEK